MHARLSTNINNIPLHDSKGKALISVTFPRQTALHSVNPSACWQSLTLHPLLITKLHSSPFLMMGVEEGQITVKYAIVCMIDDW